MIGIGSDNAGFGLKKEIIKLQLVQLLKKFLTSLIC